jgi:hypothetical protein
MMTKAEIQGKPQSRDRWPFFFPAKSFIEKWPEGKHCDAAANNLIHHKCQLFSLRTNEAFTPTSFRYFFVIIFRYI